MAQGEIKMFDGMLQCLNFVLFHSFPLQDGIDFKGIYFVIFAAIIAVLGVIIDRR